jgi:hypothetical protein
MATEDFALTVEQRKQIAVDQLARLLFARFKRFASSTSGSPPFYTYNYGDERGAFLKGAGADSALLQRKFNDAWESLVERGVIRWIANRFYVDGVFQLTARGRASAIDKDWIDPADVELARIEQRIGAPVDPVVAAYLREAIASFYAERYLATMTCVGVAAERVAALLAGWLRSRSRSLPAAGDRPAPPALIEACRQALSELAAPPGAADSLAQMAGALTTLAHAYGATRDRAGEPVTPPADWDTAAVAAQLSALVHSYVPALYAILRLP